MRRETQNVLLLLVGGAVLKIALDGQYLRYVKPSLQPWLIIAGAVTVALAVIAIVRDIRRNGPSEHEHGGSHSPWLLLLPALAIVLVAPPALGADKVARSGDRSIVAQPSEPTLSALPLPVEEAPLMRLSDAVVRAVWDGSGSLYGRQIRLVGFVVRTPDGVHLARLVLGCCAADATPVKVRMEGDGLGGYQPDTWLEVRGEMLPRTATEANGYTPTFLVSDAHEVPVPHEQYEF